MPGLPNHFMIFGPYGWTGGTWHVLVETASTHIMRVHRARPSAAARASVEVRPEAAERWTDVRRATALGRLAVAGRLAARPRNRYYFDRHGDTPFLRPTSSAAGRGDAARTFPLDDYAFTDRRGLNDLLRRRGPARRADRNVSAPGMPT